MKHNEYFHSYISDDNEQDAFDSYAHLFYPLQNFESGILVSSMLTVWDNIDGFAQKYRCALTVLSS